MIERQDGPLAGVRVLDLTRLLPGGYGTLLLSDLGADVIKVEEPGRGDYLRWVPPLVEGQSAAHRALNRGKRSITLNVRHPEGVGLLRRLAREADALVESFRPGVMDRLGVGYETLSAENPGLVWCAITGYGQDGPYRDLPGHDINYVGYAGILSMTGSPGGPPVLPGVQIADLGGGGMLGAVGLLAALVGQRSTGRGGFVDVSMLDGVISWLSIHAGAYLAGSTVPTPGSGPLTGGLACYRIYAASDGGHITVGALEAPFWRALCDRLGCADMIQDQYGPPETQELIAARLAAIFATRTRDEWVEAFRDVPACVGPVNDLGEALGDPHVAHRHMLAELDGAPVGPGRALKMSDLTRGDFRPAPGLGEHTKTILATLGIGDSEIDRLRSAGVI